MKFKIVIGDGESPELEVGLVVQGDRVLLRARHPGRICWTYLLELRDTGIRRFHAAAGLGINLTGREGAISDCGTVPVGNLD